MTIPFLSLFKKKTAKEAPAPAAPLPPVEKPSADRFSKTVMPNASRPLSPQDDFGLAAPVGMASAPPSAGGRTIAFGSGGSSDRHAGLPPAVALALEPKVERAISLELADVVSHLPAGLVRPLANGDGSRRVLLKASELEKGMAQGKPTVSLATIFQQVPEIFVQQVPPADSTQVQLPFDKVMEQFSKLQVRADQHSAQAVPQVQTPFLKVTLEDDTKFGTKNDVQTAADLPEVRLEPATAETIAAAEPEAATAARFGIPATASSMPFSFRPPAAEPNGASSNGNGANGRGTNGRTATPAEPKPAAPARIPFKLTPNGTGEPATERVPASSGPPVPTSAPVAPPAPATPTRIPFKVTQGGDENRLPSEPWLTKESFAAAADAPAEEVVAASAIAPAKPAGLTIALALKPILDTLPPFQLTGDVSAVPDDAKVELPFALVEPQLASGRVIITPEDFAQGMPEEFRALFNAQEAAGTVSLPLQDVLKNLPTASLQMRNDQIEQEQGEDFATPFSAKAQEDAQRFNVAAAPVARPVVLAPAAPVAVPLAAEPEPAAPSPLKVVAQAPARAETEAAEESAAAAPGTRTSLQAALDTDDELDAKAVVAQVGKMAGIKACAIMFGDGLSLAGNLPAEYEADGLCAMAPSLLQRIDNHMVETNLGELRAMTLSCAKAAITFFMEDNLCLAALHSQAELASDVRDRLARAVHELSKKYSNPV